MLVVFILKQGKRVKFGKNIIVENMDYCIKNKGNNQSKKVAQILSKMLSRFFNN
jgi:hypothetical protein